MLEFRFDFEELPVVKSAVCLDVTCDARVEDSLEQGVHLALIVNLERLDRQFELLFVFADLVHCFQFQICQCNQGDLRAS